MKTRSPVSFVVAVGLLGGAGQAIFVEGDAHAQSSTAGAVRGVIKDKATGDAVIGATVVISGPALQGQQAEITDENGQYVINNLPPGTYVITVFYNEAQFDRPNVLIQVGKQVVVNVSINTAEAVGGETIVVEGRAPIVDQGSTKTGPTITSEYTENIPVGRTFGAVLGAAAGSQDDTYGASFSGATSVESTYIVEGVNTTDTAYGGISSNLPNEFIQETEIITGGYNAEFGRSTGGVINVVTKSGSNEFHGSVFAYYTPGQLVADSDKIVREGQAISLETNLDYAYDIGAEVGGPIIKDKLWFHVGFNPSARRSTTDRIVSTLFDEDGDGIADLDPMTGLTRAEEAGRTGLPGKVDTYFYTAKLNGAISEDHQWQLSAWGNPATVEAASANIGGVSAPSRTRFGREDGAYDASLKWTSKFAEGKSQLDIVGGFHRGYQNDKPLADAFGGNLNGADPLIFWNYERSLADFGEFDAVPDACMPTDETTGFNNCPVINYGIGGLGFFEQRTNDRYSGQIAWTQRVKAAGYHTFKGGLEMEQTTYNSARGFTSGIQLRQNVAGNFRVRQYIVPDDAGDIPCIVEGTFCSPVTTLNADTTNINYGAYLQDSWQIRPNFTVNAGLRWEQQNGYTAEFLHGQTSPAGEPIPDKAFQLNNQLAPRVGAIYDPTQEGRAKVFGHWGRFYETMPMDINVRAFGGETLLTENVLGPNCPDVNPFDPESIAACPRQVMGEPGAPTTLGGGTEYVAAGTKGQYIDELILGTEYEFMPDFKMGLNYVHRDLPMVIEDMSADSANYYLIGNPGQDYDDLAADFESQADEIYAAQDCMGETPGEDCALADEYYARAFNLSRIDAFDKPIRTYDAIQVTANQRFSKNALLLASYTFSRTFGNFPGLFSTETDQLDPNLTSMYDLQDLMANRYGPMGLDRPHNFKLDGFYQFDLKEAGIVILGASFRAQSGLAQNTLGAHFIYGSDESYLLPRGAIARAPMTWETDIKATYGRKFGKNTRVEGFIDVFNLFNNQEETDRDESYTLDSMNPIVGGDANDLRHGKALDPVTGTEVNSTALKYANFGRMIEHQAPLQVRFGVRVTF
jgi:outer membrane receptor protein involved in Fe transport